MPTQCPIASFSCDTVVGRGTKYTCRAATTAVLDHPAQLAWSVSDGKLIGNRKSYELIVDTSRVKSQTITVTLKVHWKNFDRICDRTVTDTIELR
jgi:hypothetical protein